MISYVIPTRDQPAELAWTLEAISRLGDHHQVGGAEVIVADTGSSPPVSVGGALPSGVLVRAIRCEGNAISPRNIAARAAHDRSEWLVMLGDNSHPVHAGFFMVLADAVAETAAVAAQVVLPSPEDSTRYEQGGLPEVFMGRGVAIRRRAFISLGGYDASLQGCAEDNDLCARIILAGLRVEHDRRFVVMHRPSMAHHDPSAELQRSVRNSVWLSQRYAPADQLDWHVEHALARYRCIATAQNAIEGYERGVAELMSTRARQVRRALPRAWWDRFTGLHHARRAMDAAQQQGFIDRAAFVATGQNAWAVRQAAFEVGIAECALDQSPDALIIETLDPGEIRSAIRTFSAGQVRVVSPWLDVQGVESSARA